MASVDPKDIESLVELFNQSDWQEMHLKTDELEIFLSNDPAATGPSQSAATSAATTAVANGEAVNEPTVAASDAGPTTTAAKVTEVAEGMAAVSAPNLGTFYRAPKPGSPPYVEIGQKIDADTEVCLIEVMKLFTPVRAGVAGIVCEICIDDGQMVEFGELLVVIDPQG